MKEKNILDKLTLIFQDVFDDEDIYLDENTCSDDIEEWNSLNHISLILEIQEKWNIIIQPEQIVELTDVGRFVSLISNHMNQEAFF
jgi:acyl carrier protein